MRSFAYKLHVDWTRPSSASKLSFFLTPKGRIQFLPQKIFSSAFHKLKKKISEKLGQENKSYSTKTTDNDRTETIIPKRSKKEKKKHLAYPVYMHKNVVHYTSTIKMNANIDNNQFITIVAVSTFYTSHDPHVSLQELLPAVTQTHPPNEFRKQNEKTLTPRHPLLHPKEKPDTLQTPH